MRRAKWAVVALILLGIAALAGTAALGFNLSVPASAKVGPLPNDIAGVTVAIPSGSGSELKGWFVQGNPGSGAIVLLHGVRSNRAAMLSRIRLFRAAGFSVFAFDFQAHGESSGNLITFGLLESNDVQTALAFLRRKLPEEKIGAIGISMGGAAALVGSDSLDVNALVLEAVYPDIATAVANRIDMRLGAIGRAMAAPYVYVMGPILGIDASALRPVDRLKSFKGPLLMIAGSEDRHTTITETKAMFASANEPKELWVVDGAAHVDLQAFAPAEYEKRVVDFLKRALRGQT